MAQSVLKHLRAVIRDLGREYQISDEEEILAFLERYPAVAPLLFEIRSNIRRYFGENPVRLDVSYDLEGPEEVAELFANIQTELTPMEALDRLHKFDDEWWIERLTATRAPLVVSLHLI